MTNKTTPLPTNVWPSSQHEIAIAFDKPVSPEALQGVKDRIKIHYGDHVRAGDEFETLAPPYASCSVKPDRREGNWKSMASRFRVIVGRYCCKRMQ